MNHQLTQMFVVKQGTTLLTSGTTSDLAEGQVGVFNSSGAAVSAAPSVTTSPYILLAQGSGKNTVGSWKSQKVYLKKVLRWAGEGADTSSKEQITYVGFDEINDCKSPSIGCDRTYNITIRVFEHYLNTVYVHHLQEGVTVKSGCCDNCGSNCDDLGCLPIMEEFAAKFNANPRLSPYVTVTAVSKLLSGSAVDPTFCITLPDPGTSVGGVVDFTQTNSAAGLTNGTNTGVASSSNAAGTGATFNVVVAGNVVTSVAVNAAGSGYEIGETLTIAGTALTGGTTPADDITIIVTQDSGPEGDLIGEIRTMYADSVDDAEVDIVYSTDADSTDSDSNATGNVMIVMTPSTDVTIDDIEDYKGISWEECPCASEGTAVYACGLKFTGITPDDFTNNCTPDAIPYRANKTRFKVFAGEGPIGTQYVDLPDPCNIWDITDTQIPSYPVGESAAIAEMERNTYGWKEPYSNHKYWINYFNDDFNYFATSGIEYDIYHLEYEDPSPSGFLQKDPDKIEVLIAVDTANTSWKTAFETVMNTYLANSPAYQGSVTL